MKKYPENTPKMFIDYHQSDLAFSIVNYDSNLSYREIIERFIFDDRLQNTLKPLSKRIVSISKTEHAQQMILLSLCLNIEKGLKGPSVWESMTPKEKEIKIEKIKSLLSLLSNEMIDTPYDAGLQSFIFDSDDYRTSGKLMLKGYSLKNEVDMLETEEGALRLFEKIINTSIFDFFEKMQNYNFEKKKIVIFKRRINIERLYFIRVLSSFFEDNFKTPLYKITSEISSCFLNKDITPDDVRAALKK